MPPGHLPRPGPHAGRRRSRGVAAPSHGISRRSLLRGVGAAGLAGLLAACGIGDEAPPTAADPDAEDPRERSLQAVGADAPLDLMLVLPAAEFVVGEDRRFVFGLATADREFLSGLDVEISLVSDDEFDVVDGPRPATAYEDFGALGVYGARLSYPRAGIYRVVAVTPDAAAVGALQVIEPEASGVPQLDEEFPSSSTPTVDDPGDLAELCTRDPDCSMHDVSLDEALDEGRPVVLTVSTPAYCATAICGPVVEVIEGVKESSDRDDVAWIHVEVYEDAGNTPTELVTSLGLPSEPWTFFIGADGVVADRIEGPTPREIVTEALATI